MNNSKKNISILDVPYFKQTRYFTCGPAALMMIFKYWDKSFQLTKNNEFNIWIRSNPFVFFGGTLQYGLAKTANKMGFKVKILQKNKLIDLYPKRACFFKIIQYILYFGIRNKKIPIQYGVDPIEMISEALNKKIPPLVFINLLPIIGENVFHWIVVTGMDKENIYINDPYVPNFSKSKIKKDYQIKINIFKDAISTDRGNHIRLPQNLVLVYK